MNIVLPQQVNQALSLLHQRGYEAYIVGGCVRDYLLSQQPQDFDITTNATPQQVLQVFQDYKTIETGLKHGTVTVMIESMPLEITTYRIDGEYSDHRRPDSVMFTKQLADDLARRDFTMNAIAYSPQDGIQDFYSGKRDIEAKRIRCVGNPQKRFEEDALRIMRALRFASVLGFQIEKETKSAIFEKKELLKDIAAERIAVELTKLLCGAHARAIIAEYIDVLGVVIPELLPMNGYPQNNSHHVYDVLTHCLVALESIEPVPYLRWVALLHDSGKPFVCTEDNGVAHFYGHPELSAQIAKDVLQRLRFDNETVDIVFTLIYDHDRPIETNKKSIKRWLNRLSPELFEDLLKVKWADNMAKNPQHKEPRALYQKIEDLYHEVIEEKACFSLKNLQISGYDLIAIGITNGILIGKIKQRLLELVMDEQIENEKSQLMNKAKELYNDAKSTP
jgi:tRNA nucleotidyltransferase (CCA-adding enzyme)